MITDIATRIESITSRVVGAAGTTTPGAATAPGADFGAMLGAATTPAAPPARTGSWPGTALPGTIGAMLAMAAPPSPTTSTYGPLGPPIPTATIPAGALSGDAAERRAALAPAFAEAGARHGIDPALLEAVAWTESNFDPTAVSPAGAIGLMQIMPGTAGDLGVDPTDPLQAIDGAARYLRQQLDRFGDVRLALAAYNAGPGAVQNHGGIPPYPETTAYVATVTSRYESLRGASA
jgi:soluble lytic murein transglycosylase-like protein